MTYSDHRSCHLKKNSDKETRNGGWDGGGWGVRGNIKVQQSEKLIELLQCKCVKQLGYSTYMLQLKKIKDKQIRQGYFYYMVEYLVNYIIYQEFFGGNTNLTMDFFSSNIYI